MVLVDVSDDETVLGVVVSDCEVTDVISELPTVVTRVVVVVVVVAGMVVLPIKYIKLCFKIFF